ncbi:unnamed protein product [Arctia plantaginis]|uniref:Methuselah N-terminal domain-containing protein n=1 Tax=Arctia plantaginis TaxID=874455 RepID=A0A8S0Z3C9_ARCPL|nr:unnamed protein product [Arctia plantaginis]
MLPIIFVLFITVSASGQPCNDIDSVYITKGKTLKDGSIEDGVVFPPKYVYSKYVDGEWKTLGCLCKLKNCFRKCCPLGFVMHYKNCVERRDQDLILNNGLDLYDGVNFRGKKFLEQTDFGLVFGKPNSECYIEDPGWFVQEVSN